MSELADIRAATAIGAQAPTSNTTLAWRQANDAAQQAYQRLVQTFRSSAVERTLPPTLEAYLAMLGDQPIIMTANGDLRRHLPKGLGACFTPRHINLDRAVNELLARLQTMAIAARQLVAHPPPANEPTMPPPPPPPQTMPPVDLPATRPPTMPSVDFTLRQALRDLSDTVTARLDGIEQQYHLIADRLTSPEVSEYVQAQQRLQALYSHTAHGLMAILHECDQWAAPEASAPDAATDSASPSSTWDQLRRQEITRQIERLLLEACGLMTIAIQPNHPYDPTLMRVVGTEPTDIPARNEHVARTQHRGLLDVTTQRTYIKTEVILWQFAPNVPAVDSTLSL